MKLGRVLFMASAFGVLASRTGAAHAEDETFDYVVQPGDKCDAIAARVYGNAARIDLVHAMNPQLGPPPHNLKPGTILKLKRVAGTPTLPDAKLSFVRNRVDAFTPGQHPGKAEEPLMRGHRVSTFDASSAEVRFASNAVIQLGERTLVVILGSTRGAVTHTGTASDTSLVNGSLRSRLSTLAGKPANVAVTTPAGHKVELHPGEAQVSVDPKQTTRVAVYKGSSSITSQKKTVAVDEGFGSKAEKDKPPTPPRPLPPAPKWVTALPAVVLTSAPVDVSGQFGASAGAGPAPAKWHVQIARDDSFNDLVVDATVPLAVTKVEAHALVAGTYLARVSAIDDDQFEGAPSPTSIVIVSPMSIKVAANGGQDATLDLPAGLFCGLDGAPLAPVSGPLAFKRGPERRVRCASTADGEGASDATIPAQSIGPLAIAASLASSEADTGRVVLDVRDAAKAPVVGSKLVARALATDGVTLSEVVPGDAPGRYVATAHWPRGATRLHVQVTANGIDVADAPAILLPTSESAPAPLAVREPAFELGILGGVAIPAGDLGTGGVLGLELGHRWQRSRFSFALGLRATWEHHTFDGSAACSAGPSPSTAASGAPCANAYSFSLADDMFGFALPISARLGAANARLLPYVGLAPILFADYSATSFTKNNLVTSGSDTRALLGFQGFLGAEIRVTENGRFFLEGGYRVTPDLSGAAGTFSRTAWLFDLGYRTGL